MGRKCRLIEYLQPEKNTGYFSYQLTEHCQTAHFYKMSLMFHGIISRTCLNDLTSG